MARNYINDDRMKQQANEIAAARKQNEAETLNPGYAQRAATPKPQPVPIKPYMNPVDAQKARMADHSRQNAARGIATPVAPTTPPPTITPASVNPASTATRPATRPVPPTQPGLTPQIATNTPGPAPLVDGRRINRLTGKPFGWLPGDDQKPAAPAPVKPWQEGSANILSSLPSTPGKAWKAQPQTAAGPAVAKPAPVSTVPQGDVMAKVAARQATPSAKPTPSPLVKATMPNRNTTRNSPVPTTRPSWSTATGVLPVGATASAKIAQPVKTPQPTAEEWQAMTSRQKSEYTRRNATPYKFPDVVGSVKKAAKALVPTDVQMAQVKTPEELRKLQSMTPQQQAAAKRKKG